MPDFTTTISVDVSCGQIAVFSPALDQPFNDWTDEHVAQGFAWRPGSVSFRTLAEAGAHSIEITVVDHLSNVDPGAVRAIEAPFEVPAAGAIEVASISDGKVVPMAPGSYLLRCEFLQSGDAAVERVRLVFAKKVSVTATPEFVVDFVARGETADEWRMVLVEQGPWSPPFTNELRRLQTRLYDCIDAALDGQLATKFPESRGKRTVVQLDCYRLPNAEVDAFFHRFAAGALATDEYSKALASCPFVSAMSFELNLN